MEVLLFLPILWAYQLILLALFPLRLFQISQIPHPLLLILFSGIAVLLVFVTIFLATKRKYLSVPILLIASILPSLYDLILYRTGMFFEPVSPRQIIYELLLPFESVLSGGLLALAGIAFLFVKTGPILLWRVLGCLLILSPFLATILINYSIYWMY